MYYTQAQIRWSTVFQVKWWIYLSERGGVCFKEWKKGVSVIIFYCPVSVCCFWTCKHDIYVIYPHLQDLQQQSDVLQLHQVWLNGNYDKRGTLRGVGTTRKWVRVKYFQRVRPILSWTGTHTLPVMRLPTGVMTWPKLEAADIKTRKLLTVHVGSQPKPSRVCVTARREMLARSLTAAWPAERTYTSGPSWGWKLGGQWETPAEVVEKDPTPIRSYSTTFGGLWAARGDTNIRFFSFITQISATWSHKHPGIYLNKAIP